MYTCWHTYMHVCRHTILRYVCIHVDICSCTHLSKKGRALPTCWRPRHTYTYTYIHAYIYPNNDWLCILKYHICIHTYIHTYTHAHTYTSIQIMPTSFVYLRTYKHTCMQTYIYLNKDRLLYSQIAYVYIHTYIHTSK